tara:strand:- start:1576 stop:2043 length:468 start_codon:yes stop_codon:yes gene_type:complete
MKFDLTLQANFWNTSPSILVKLDNKIIKEFNSFVDKQKTTISVEVNAEDSEHQLVIERQNKSIKDTVLNDSKIIKDSTINIEDVVIDNISIEPLLDKAFFYPQYPEPWLSQQKQIGKDPPIKYDYCRILHHNGEWKLNFTSPIHVWFFQNITLEI